MNGFDLRRPAASAHPSGREVLRPHGAAWGDGFFARLAPHDLTAIAPLLSETPLVAGQELYAAGTVPQHVYLIDEGLVRLSIPFADGRDAATTLVGREGVVGISAAVSGAPAVESSTVMVTGHAHRLPTSAVGPLLQDHRGVAAVVAQAISRQVAELQVELACRAFHSVEQRLARLLLEASWKLVMDRFHLTQEELARMLNVQRTTVSALATKLKGRGAVAYLRGAIRIVHPGRLAAAACGCGHYPQPPSRTPGSAAEPPGQIAAS
jgi:CRP-like cAMP-binding protein